MTKSINTQHQNMSKTRHQNGTKKTRSGSVLMGLIPPAATNLSFSKSRSKSRSSPLGQKYWYLPKGLATRNTHVKYESPISFGSKFIAKVKFFQK